MVDSKNIGNIPTNNLTDREILLLTYQQLQNVSDEFRADKARKDILLHDLDHRIDVIENLMGTAESIKQSADQRAKKQLQNITIVVTVVNVVIGVIIALFFK